MSDIKTFSQALPILTARGIEVLSAGNRLWSIGAMTYDKGGIIALARRYEQEAKVTALDIEAPPAALSVQMQTYAQGYIDARKRAGDALLDQARFLALARDAAQYGEWKIFLEATQTSEDWAGRLLNIHDTAERDPRFADAIRTNFLNLSTAYELTSAPADLRDRLLSSTEPPTRAQIRDEKRAANSAPARSLGPGQPAPEPWPEAPEGWRWNRKGAPAHLIAPGGWRTADYNYPERALAEAQQYMVALSSFWQSIDAHHPTAHFWTRERPDLLRSACGMTIQNRLPSGSTEGGHCSSCVRAMWPQNQAAPAPAHDLADILKRLDAHGYARTTTRVKGSTTYHSFRDYGGDHDETGGEIELAEGELSFWLTELDEKAQRAQERQAQYLDAQARFLALGWSLTRAGAKFVLCMPTGAHYATGAMDNHLCTLQTFETAAAKKAAAAAVPTLADLDACMPKTLEAAGYYWKSASPIVIAHNDGWTGEAGLIAIAITLAADREKARSAIDWYDRAEALAGKALEYADHGSRHAAVALAMEFASYLAGDDLAALSEHLDDATYEALAAYRRDRSVPTLESEGI